MSQRRIQKEIRASEEIKWIHNVPEPGVGASLRKMFITMNTHIIDYFIPQKMRNKDLPVVSRRKAVIKVRAEINRREGKTQQEQNQEFIYLYIYIFFYFYIPVTVFSPQSTPSRLFCSWKHRSPMSISKTQHIELQCSPPHVLRLAKETQCEE